uniref:MATH domain-containing protein n=1 Tax=Biomphalaria glabrata TaxID=6526 RepID=A0A2C9M0T7_BIOGL
MTFKWTISDYFSKLRSEHLGYIPKQISSPFYLAHCGYRCQMEAYLNGDGTARDKGLSVFLRVIRGDYDKLLTWPVYLSLDIVLINQS